MIMTAARSDSVALFEVHTGRESLTAHSSGRAANLDIAVARPSVSKSLSVQQIPSECNRNVKLRDVIRNEQAGSANSVE